MSLQDKAKQDQKSEYANQGGNWFKFKEGDNKIRVLTEPQAIYEDYKLGMCYTDCRFKGNIKYLAFIFDHADNAVKLMKIPFGVFQNIADFELDEDFKFEAFPMPYSLNVKAVGAGTKEVKYTTIPSPKRSDVTPEVINQISKKGKIVDIIESMKTKNMEKHKSDGTWDRLHEDKDLEKPDDLGMSEDIPY